MQEPAIAPAQIEVATRAKSRRVAATACVLGLALLLCAVVGKRVVDAWQAQAERTRQQQAHQAGAPRQEAARLRPDSRATNLASAAPLASENVGASPEPRSRVATLASLELSAGTLSPGFASAATNYSASVPNSIASVMLTPAASDPNATIRLGVNGGAFNSMSSARAGDQLALKVGSNSINVEVTAPDRTTVRTYTLTITRAPSANANLAGLELSAGALSPGFASATTGYSASVPNSVTSVVLAPTASDQNATIRLRISGGAFNPTSSGGPSDRLALKVGSNRIEAEVTAQDRITVRTYALTVTRAPSANANLASLELSAGALSPGFAAAATSYSASVPSSVASVTLTPTALDQNATIRARVNGGAFNTVSSGGPSGQLALKPGRNLIEVELTAPDRTTVRTYALTVTRAPSGNASLASLELSVGTLSPGFASEMTAYGTTVPNSVTSVILTPTALDQNATIWVRVNGGPFNPVSSGGFQRPVSPQGGPESYQCEGHCPGPNEGPDLRSHRGT